MTRNVNTDGSIEIPLPRPHLRAVANRDGVVILDISRDQITTLNPTGGFVWEKLRQGRTVEQAIQDLATESNTDLATVDRGVRTFVEQLKSQRLLSL
jgi:hypothetical protein